MKKPVVLLAAGIVLFFISLTADAFGIGEGTGIGWKQILGTVVGLAIAALGLVKLKQK
jgi:hypothetical protein